MNATKKTIEVTKHWGMYQPPSRINTTDYVRPTTAARILGVGRARVKQLIAAGLLPAVDIDGVWHVRRADVERRAAGESPKRSGPRPGTKPE